MKGAFTIAAFVVMTHGSRAAAADAPPGDSEAARLFQEAKALMEQGRFAEACPKLDRSRTLDPQVGTTLNLAFCYERLGKTATSWALWLDGASEASEKGQTQREALARRRAALLETRLLRITILVAPQEASAPIELQLDGVSVPKSRWGAPTPVDPGPHWVQANAEGKRPWKERVEVDDQHVPLVEVGVLEPRETEGERHTLARPVSPRRTAALILGGTGVAALAGMTALGLVAKATYADSASYCRGDRCMGQGTADRDRAALEAGLATAAAVTGGCAIAGSAVLWFTGAPGPVVHLQPTVGRRDVGVAVEGAW